MLDSIMNSDWIFWAIGGLMVLAILVVAYLRYSTVRFRTQVAFQHNEAGMELMRKGRYAEAIREFEIALSLDPNVEIFKNNIEIAKMKLMEQKRKRQGQINALGLEE